MAGCEASASARWLSFCRPCSHFFRADTERPSEKPNKAKFVFVTLFVTIRRRSRCRIRSEKDPDWHPPITI
jgi:hypothetical protein